jgi:hypothetical protein
MARLTRDQMRALPGPLSRRLLGLDTASRARGNGPLDLPAAEARRLRAAVRAGRRAEVEREDRAEREEAEARRRRERRRSGGNDGR